VTQHVPDLLITDLKMPEMDGFVMLKTLRDVDVFSNMAIVVVTAMQAHEIEENGGLPNGIKVLGKNPIHFWDLRELVQGLIDIK